MSLNHCILGLIAHRPLSGYDLKATFDESVAYIYNASESQIYAALRQLERAGLVSREVIYQEHRPNKKMYSITPSGQDELRRWLAEPVPEKYSKDEFLVKVMFGNETGDAVVTGHIRNQIQNLEKQLEHMERERQRLSSSSTDAGGRTESRARRYRILSLNLKIASTKAQLEECKTYG